MTAEYKVHGDVAVITMNNPPVNGLGLSTRQGITDGLAKAEADPAVKAIVLTGAGKAFSGGADIREFGTPKALAEPNLLSVILAVENSRKPVVEDGTLNDDQNRRDFTINALKERGRLVAPGTEYVSDKNPHFLTVEELAQFNQAAMT